MQPFNLYSIKFTVFRDEKWCSVEVPWKLCKQKVASSNPGPIRICFIFSFLFIYLFIYLSIFFFFLLSICYNKILYLSLLLT